MLSSSDTYRCAMWDLGGPWGCLSICVKQICRILELFGLEKTIKSNCSHSAVKATMSLNATSTQLLKTLQGCWQVGVREESLGSRGELAEVSCAGTADTGGAHKPSSLTGMCLCLSFSQDGAEFNPQ